MTALDIIIEKPTKDMGKLELAIFTLWNSFSEDELAEAAAAELATITALLKEAGEALDLFVPPKSMEDMPGRMPVSLDKMRRAAEIRKKIQEVMP